ncbi:glycosyl hydrolase family 47-domain-containing protein [Neurospora tetraspora]|uniref:alpha-1,2-Mannosidase n=1 Tax=Neurospora tetraspora TaxID=94610 RepID=A0AAE0MVP7_9PEZI|nr:glycosyl hydrolase family 47-domain-containing protein [Neurospora tetraspora]
MTREPLQPRLRPHIRSRSRPRSSPWLLALALLAFVALLPSAGAMRPSRVADLRREVVDMFYHGFDNYMRIAFPEDELRPVTCAPLTRDAKNPGNVEVNDVLGNYSLTLIDTLSTLAIFASAPPDDRGTGPKALRDFQDGVAALVEQYGDGRPGPSGQGLRARGFDVDSKVQVFETVIRGVGGLLSAHLFAVGALPINGYEPLGHEDDPLSPPPIHWPNGLIYDGQLLRLALDLGTRILPAFYTKTGMPYPRVNLRHGIPFYKNSPLHETSSGDHIVDGPPEITETCSAGAGSLVLEFTVLSRLTGDPRFEQLAKRAFWAVWYRKSHIGLLGAGVDAEQGHWVGPYSVVGAGADSFFEYALKSHILLSGHELPNRTAVEPKPKDDWLDPNTLFAPLTDVENSPDAFLQAWHHAHAAIKRHLYSDRDHPHYENVNLWTGSLATNWVDSLGAFYAGLLVLAGEVEEAIETSLLYTAIWARYAALPERWSITHKDIEGGLGWWPLRPEFIESTYYIYQATKDPWYLYVGEMVMRDIQRRCTTQCGWAGLQNVLTGEKSDRMESFFLGETTQYLYLLFDESHPLNKLDAAFVFTTEGHPLILPKAKSSVRSRTSGHKELIVYHDPAYTNTCPAPPSITPLTGSVIAARDDIFHAAKMLDLHLLQPKNRLGLPAEGSKPSGQHTSSRKPETELDRFTPFPWSLPPEMIPQNATCRKINQPVEMLLEFSSNAQELIGGSAFNYLIGTQNLERLTMDRIRVQTLSGLRLTMRQEEDSDGEWRVSKVNGVLLGRDEFIVMNRAILGEVSDPRFNLVRDPVNVKFVHLHHVDLGQDEADKDKEQLQPESGNKTDDNDVSQEKEQEDEVSEQQIETANTTSEEPASSSLGSYVKSLLANLAASLDDLLHGIPLEAAVTALPSILPSIPSISSIHGTTKRIKYPFNVFLNSTAVTATGIGAAPLPPPPPPPSSPYIANNPAHPRLLPAFGPVPRDMIHYTTIYAAGQLCSASSPNDSDSENQKPPLDDSIPRTHQILLLRRGGCSFSEKLANIPAFPPSPTSLQLVVVVSDGDDEDASYAAYYSGQTYNTQGVGGGLARPLLDQVQKTPGGLVRRNPIPMIMVGGGEMTYETLKRAKGVAVGRRWFLESQGRRVRNVIVDEGDAGGVA